MQNIFTKVINYFRSKKASTENSALTPQQHIQNALEEYLEGKTFEEIREFTTIQDQLLANGTSDSALQVSHLIGQLEDKQKQELILSALKAYIKDRPKSLSKLFEIAQIQTECTFAKVLEKLNPDKVKEFVKFLDHEWNGIHFSITNMIENLPEAAGRGAVVPGLLSLFLSMTPGVTVPIFSSIAGATLWWCQREHREIVKKNVIFSREQIEENKSELIECDNNKTPKLSNSTHSMWKTSNKDEVVVTPQSSLVLGK